MKSSNVSIIMDKMKGYEIVKKSKERKMDKKSKHKALAILKTEKSRARRLANKALREAIHEIDPNLKIKIIDQKTYVDVGYLNEVKVINGSINTVEEEVIAIAEEAEMEVETIIEVDSKFKQIINKWRAK